MKTFKHHCQPYGTVELKDATYHEAEVANYVGYNSSHYFNTRSPFDGTKKIMRVTGTVVSSKMVSLFGGVAVTKGRDRYEKGSIHTIDNVSNYEWKQGYKISVAM